MTVSTGDTVTIEYTGRLDDGTVFDTSRAAVAADSELDDEDRDFTPLTVDIGAGRIIEGLEEALVGLDVDDEDTVTIEPAKAYGDRSEDRIVSYDAAEFTAMIEGTEPTVGTRVETEDGLPGEVVDVDDDVVRVDFNHELAGETLEFDVEVVDVQ
jgi:FKBP-type peptidyl-prolyl cis-trans isomerase 2